MELAALLREYIQDVEEVLQERGTPVDAGELLLSQLESILLEKRFPSEMFSCSECSHVTENRLGAYRHVIDGHNRGPSLYRHSEFSGEPPTFDVDEITGEYICNLCGERAVERDIKRNWASRHGVPCRNRFKLELTYQCLLPGEGGESCSGEAATLDVFLDHLDAFHEDSPLFVRLTDRDKILKKLEEKPKRSEIGEFVLRFRREAEKIVDEYLPYFEALLASNTACVKTPQGWALASSEPEEVLEVPPAVSPEETVVRRLDEEKKERERAEAEAKAKKKTKKPRAAKPKAKSKPPGEPEVPVPAIEVDEEEEVEAIEIDSEQLESVDDRSEVPLPGMIVPSRPFAAPSKRIMPPMPPGEVQPANFGLYESALLCLLIDLGTISEEEADEQVGRFYTVPADHHRVVESGGTFWEESISDGFKHLVDIGFAEAVSDHWTPTDKGRVFYDQYLGKSVPVEDSELDEMDGTGEYSTDDLLFAEEGPSLGYTEEEDASGQTQAEAGAGPPPSEAPEPEDAPETQATDDEPEFEAALPVESEPADEGPEKAAPEGEAEPENEDIPHSE